MSQANLTFRVSYRAASEIKPEQIFVVIFSRTQQSPVAGLPSLLPWLFVCQNHKLAFSTALILTSYRVVNSAGTFRLNNWRFDRMSLIGYSLGKAYSVLSTWICGAGKV